MTLDRDALLEAYDQQLRTYMEPGVDVETDGPVVRAEGYVTYRSVAHLAGDELDALIARQREVAVARGQAVEWKLHGHDEPADLPERLAAAGFVPEEEETVLIGLAEPLADPTPAVPDGVVLREVTDRADLDAIEDLKIAVWGGGRAGLADALERERAADPSAITIVAAPTGDVMASAGWVRYAAGTPFATLWGGATLPQWRGRGIYRALVAYRAWLAVTRGYSYLEVDASSMSRPILQRLGFVAVTTTTPYVYSPVA